MQRPASSKLGRKYDYRPPRAEHELLRTAARPYVLGVQAKVLDAAVDWRHLMRPVRDQGQEGSCFAFATAALKEFNCAVWGGATSPLGGYLSPAYLSWRTRLAEGTFPADSGASLADAMEVLRAWGAPPEDFLPYRADPGQAGNAGCDVAAHPYRVGTPVVVPLDEPHLDAVLAARHVVALGFAVHESFEETGRDGVVPPVQPGEGLLGGHAVVIVGKTAEGLYIVRNSWAESWGLGGHCLMTPTYVAATGFEGWTTA